MTPTDVSRARRAASERALDAARVKLASTSRDIRRRALRALIVANVTGACDASVTARDPEVLRAVLEMYDRADDAFDERARDLEAAAATTASGDAATCARWSPATFLTWLCEREPMAIVWLEELGARAYVAALMRDERRSEDGRAFARLAEALDAQKPPRAEDFDEDVEDARGGYDAVREARLRRARERSQAEATTSASTREEDASASRSSFAARERDATSADGDEGYALPHAAVSEEDAQYLYALTTMLDSCAHHALALGGLRELRCALADVPVEAVARVASRALERACELLSARDPRLSSPETRKEALGVIAQCAMALHRELVDASRGALSAARKARPPSPNSPIAERYLDDERHRLGSHTRVLPMAHEFMTRAIPAMADPALRADAIRTVRLLLPLIQVVPSDGEHAHGASLRRLSQYFDLCESALASVAFEPGAASEYLACVQASAEIAAVAGGARVRGVGAANASLFKRWYDVCVDEVLAAANPLAREYCARALRLVCPTLAAELALVRETDACLRFVADAARSGASARDFARATTHTSRALTIVGTTTDVRPLASRLVAALVASASAEGEDEGEADARAEALLSLMTHDLEDVRTTAYATLAASRAVEVFKHPLILSEIIVGGAHHLSTARDAATCLETLCARASGDLVVAAHLSTHAAWLDALSDDADVGDAASRACAFLADANVGGRLERLSTALRGLFHQNEKTRVRCATDLAHDIGRGVASAADVLLRSTTDPFDDVLLEDDAYVRNRDDDDAPLDEAFRESLRTRTFDDVRASLRAFIDHDDEYEMKKSREELVAELEITVRDERLAAALADPRTLDALIRVALEQGSDATVVTGAIRILAEATGACRLVRDALSREDGRGGRIAQLLGLAFHPRRRIRAATASLLARFLFTPVADAVASRVGTSRPRELSLPKLFLETYRFPSFVPELKNPPSTGDSDAFADEDVDDARVLAMFRRRQVLTHTYADEDTDDAALLAFALDDAPEDEPEETRAARDSARMSCPPFVVGEFVEALGDARSHEDAARALDGLRTIAHQSRSHAMAVLASLGRWNEASERFLRRPPRSSADARLWSLTADALAMCLHSFARIDHAVLPPGSMKALIQIVSDVIVPLASVGAPMGGDAETDVVEDPPALRHPIAAARALGEDGGARCAARADAVRASMELLTCVCDAARRFRERSGYDEDVAAALVELDIVATTTRSIISAKNCDNAARCAAVDASIAAFRLGGVPADTVRAFARATLGRVLSSSSKRPGSALADKATRAMIYIIERTPSDSWADAFYEGDDLEWVRVALNDPSPRRRARAFQTLAAAVGPGSPIADVVAVAFPDVFDLASTSALDDREAAATRAEAFRCVASLVAGSAAAESAVEVRDDGFYRGDAGDVASATPFPSLPMLAATDVWRAFARVLTGETARGDHRAAMLRRGASAALLAAARVDALGVAEAFDFNPNHEADGTMWHGAFGILRECSRADVDDDVDDDAHAAANVAALLGVVTAAGCKTMDAALAADALRARLAASVDVSSSSSSSDDALARATSRCAEALATIVQANARGGVDVTASTMTGVASTCAVALAAAVRPEASLARRRSATGTCLLVATAFRSAEASRRATTTDAFDHAGASIARSLLALWRARLVGRAAVRDRAPSAAALVAAIRNVFAHDVSAKAAACEWGVVESLIHTTLEAVRRSTNADGSFARAPTAMDVFVAASSAARRRDALAAAMEFGVDVDGRELPSTVALGSLTCLRHLMYASPRREKEKEEDHDASSRWLEEIVYEIRERAADAGVVAMFRATWPYAKMDQTIAYELLSTVVNFVAMDANAKRALTTTTTTSAADGDASTKSFAQTLMDFAFDSKHSPGSSTLDLALKALSSLATVDGPARYWLLRSAFVDETATTLAHALVKARARDDGERNATRARWMRTVHAAVRALANVASFADGQRAVLRASAGSHVLELCLEVVAEARDADDVDARREAFLLLHNLAFHGGAKSHYVAHPIAIDCLVHAVADADARCATYACAALFALSRHGQRVVATLRERGRDAALRAAAKIRRAASDADAAGSGDGLDHWSTCLRGVLFVLSADENDEAYADV